MRSVPPRGSEWVLRSLTRLGPQCPACLIMEPASEMTCQILLIEKIPLGSTRYRVVVLTSWDHAKSAGQKYRMINTSRLLNREVLKLSG
jgi:hypothetical protein